MFLINLGINDWFNLKIKNVINNSVVVAESYLEEHKETIKGEVYTMYNDINNSSNILENDNQKLAIALRTQALIRSYQKHLYFQGMERLLFRHLIITIYYMLLQKMLLIGRIWGNGNYVIHTSKQSLRTC